MKFELIEHNFQCPYCNESISIMLDPSEKKQQYIEECEVCCNSIEITCDFVDGKLEYFNAQVAE